MKINTPEKNKEKKDNNSELPKLFYSLLYSYMTWATASSVIIFQFVIIYNITLGSFNDFRELQNLMTSPLIALLSLFCWSQLSNMHKNSI